MSVKLNSNLIFDFGIGNGEDSRFYLHKGYSVVAVDADPLACKELELNCSSYLKTRLTVINCVVGGTSSASGFEKFYKNLPLLYLQVLSEGNFLLILSMKFHFDFLRDLRQLNEI